MLEYVAIGDDFSEWDSNPELTFVRADRNGTRYYSSCKCSKCNGTGYIPMYNYVEGGICFQCDGSGRHEQTYKVMTQTHDAELTQKRLAKIRKGATKQNAEFLESNGFSADGTAYVVLGDTYSVKDELKAAGAKYSAAIGWAFSSQQDKYQTVQISKDDVIEEDGNGLYHFKEMDIKSWLADKKHEKELELKAEAGNASEYVGNVGDKITAKVTVENVYWYRSHYTYYGESNAIYTMTDADGNTLVWKTSAGFDDPVQKGTELTIKATIKAHSEYKGEKQTELSRVKVA